MVVAEAPAVYDEEGISLYQKSFYLPPGKKYEGVHLMQRFCDQMNAALRVIEDYEGFLFIPDVEGAGYMLRKGEDILVCHMTNVYDPQLRYDPRLTILFMQHLIRRTCIALENDTIMESSYADTIRKACETMRSSHHHHHHHRT
jgi:hypothetical protein